MNRIDELRHQIDACRPGSDDLARAELAELRRALGEPVLGQPAQPGAADATVAAELDRARRFDQCVVSALYDVALPSGLLDKLLARASQPASDHDGGLLADAAATAREAGPPASESPVTQPAVCAGPRRPRVLSRRTTALVSGGVIAASLLALGYFQWWPASRRISEAELSAEVTHWLGEVPRWKDWHQGTPAAALTSRFPANDLQVRIARWKQFETSRGEAATVYQLVPFGGETAWLVVVATTHRYTVSPAPLSNLAGISGGYSAGTWQRENGPLFVLVVSRGGRPLRDYVLVRTPA